MVKQLRLGLVLLISSMTAYASPESVVNELRGVTHALIADLRENEEMCRANKDCLRERVRNHVIGYFDTNGIARMALGKNYRRLGRPQRAQFSIEFERLLLKTYGVVLLNNLDAKIDWRAKPIKDREQITAIALVSTEGASQPVEIHFRMRTSKSNAYEGYRIFDVKVEGISLVSNYRATFQKILRTRKFQGLMEELEKKNLSDTCPLKME